MIYVSIRMDKFSMIYINDLNCEEKVYRDIIKRFGIIVIIVQNIT